MIACEETKPVYCGRCECFYPLSRGGSGEKCPKCNCWVWVLTAHGAYRDGCGAPKRVSVQGNRLVLVAMGICRKDTGDEIDLPIVVAAHVLERHKFAAGSRKGLTSNTPTLATTPRVNAEKG